MSEAPPPKPRGPEGPAVRAARAAIVAWAVAGGLVLVALVLLTAWSTLMNLLFRAPVPGDFELVEVGVAIAAFAFLPYCQLTGANVTVDAFTMRAGPRAAAAMALVGSVAAFAFALLLLWRMSEGMADYMRYREFTPIVGFPLWMAFPPMLVSLALLALAALITGGAQAAGLRAGGTPALEPAAPRPR